MPCTASVLVVCQLVSKKSMPHLKRALTLSCHVFSTSFVSVGVRLTANKVEQQARHGIALKQASGLGGEDSSCGQDSVAETDLEMECW